MSHSHQWKDYVSHGPPAYDAFEHHHDDPKSSWGPARHSYDRQQAAAAAAAGNRSHHHHHHHSTHSLPRGGGSSSGPASNGSATAAAYGYSSYDRRSGGFQSRPPASDYAPDHYFMPSQRKYSGEVLRVYVDYNK